MPDWCPDHPHAAGVDERGRYCGEPGCSWRAAPLTSAGDFAPRPWLPTAPYYIAGGIDIRDVIEAFGLNYNRGAIVKYIARAGRKPGNDALLDLQKAREHINREIAHLSGKGGAG